MNKRRALALASTAVPAPGLAARCGGPEEKGPSAFRTTPAPAEGKA
ncbi:hypothetical protein [Streptomyces sp. NBC_00096]